jgi:DNA-binding GntR family transcriptional regulator
MDKPTRQSPGSHEPRENQRERIYHQIRRALMGGAYEPGQRITVASLSSALQTSAMPVREALRRLAAERALEMLPNRSVTVPRLSCSEILKLREVRALLEGYAAAQASQRLAVDELEELTQLQIAISAARTRRDGKMVLRLNEEFHFRIYQNAHVPTLLDLISVLWLHSAPTMNIMFRPEALMRYPDKLQTRHNEDLMRALRAGDGEGAAAAIRAEIEVGSRFLEQLMNDIGWDASIKASV